MAAADDKPTLEYQVKASYIYNFLQFIEWPPKAVSGGGILICVLGKDRFGSALDVIAGESVRGIAINVRRITNAEGLDDCRVVFVSTVERELETLILKRLVDQPVLTIGEDPGFAERGGIINLVQVQDKIRFEINQQVAARAKLKISAQLLQLAVRR